MSSINKKRICIFEHTSEEVALPRFEPGLPDSQPNAQPMSYWTPLAGEANNLKSQSQQEGMWLEAQVNLYNMWTPIGKSDVNFFFN